jgi:hypothetical protein
MVAPTVHADSIDTRPGGCRADSRDVLPDHRSDPSTPLMKSRFRPARDTSLRPEGLESVHADVRFE